MSAGKNTSSAKPVAITILSITGPHMAQQKSEKDIAKASTVRILSVKTPIATLMMVIGEVMFSPYW